MDATATAWVFSEPTEEVARRALAEIGEDGTPLGASVSSPMLGSLEVPITSLEHLESFVLPIPARAIISGFKASFHYVHPPDIPQWIRSELGDEELASCIEDINARDLVYAEAAPLIKDALAERIRQHRSALGIEPVSSEPKDTKEPVDDSSSSTA